MVSKQTKKNCIVTMSTCCLENVQQVCQLQVVNNKLVTVDPVQLLLLCVMGKYITIKTTVT